MIHGTQKMTLTHASVSEAIEDYLSVHFAPAVEIRVKSWITTPNTYGDSVTLDVEFEQMNKEQASNLLPQDSNPTTNR